MALSLAQKTATVKSFSNCSRSQPYGANFCASSRQTFAGQRCAALALRWSRLQGAAFSAGVSEGRQSRRGLSVRAALAVEPAVSPIADELAEKCVNTIRMAVVDIVETAQAGHPGSAMGLAPVGFIIWDECLRFNPRNPHWFNRDRFVLSVGHAVLLQYVLLHLTGFDLTVDDLKQLAQYGSKTPGHPENRITPGIEVTTGPLGQGFANAVGFALAEKHLGARFNKDDLQVVDHHTYVILGDGCAMEGVTNEAASLAGHWGLGKLIAFYDKNRTTIDGSTELAFTEDVAARYRALGWHVQSIPIGQYGHLEALRSAVSAAKKETQRPSLIVVETWIGYGSPSKQGTSAAHHGTFGAEEVAKIRKHLLWPYTETFTVPEDVRREMGKHVQRGAEAEAKWNEVVARYADKHPEDARVFQQFIQKELPSGWEDALPRYKPDDPPDATRGYSQTVLSALADVIPGLVGGSADLATSTKTSMQGAAGEGVFQRDHPAGRNICYGIREHAMAAISNGLALHNSGLIPFASTFLVFTDYMRGALRLSALSHAKVLWIMSHDSIGLGEDGPTHQPVEHLVSLRAIPNLFVLRPGDGNEVSGAYRAALRREDAPSVIVLSRQKLSSHLEGSSMEGVQRGGYVLTDNSEAGKLPHLILLGTGAELILCQDAARQLRGEGIRVRVVSMVCWELFEQQDEKYREEVLPPPVWARLSVEAGSPIGWREWIGPRGQTLAVNSFGASGRYLDLFRAYGFTVEHVVARAEEVLGENYKGQLGSPPDERFVDTDDGLL